MEKRFMFGIAFAILTLFFAASSVQADALDDLIASYSFDYDGGEVDVSGVNDSLAGDVFSFDVDVASVGSGDYVFYVDVEDVGGVVSGSSVVNLGSVGGIVRVDVSSYLLSGVGQFNYSLRIYDSGDSLVYKKSDFVSEVYFDYNSGIEFLGIEDSNVNDDLIQFNASLNSSFVGVENVTMFLEYAEKVAALTAEKNFGIGVNYVVFELDNETIVSGHYDGVYEVEKILVGEKLLVVDYTSSSYSFGDFAKRSYLGGVGSSFVDLDNNSLIDYLEIDFEIDVKEAGEYFVGGYVYDSRGRYLTTVIGKENLSIGDEGISVRVNGSLIYSLGFDGPYFFSVAGLIFEEEDLDFIWNVSVCGEISYLDFERPALSDLEVFAESENVTIKNNGEADAFSISVKVFNDSDEEEFVLDKLDAGEEYLFVSLFNESLAIVVDYNNLIDEENESNNVFFAVAESPAAPFVLDILWISPVDGHSGIEGEFIFSCGYNSSEGVSRVDLYGNFFGTWEVVESFNASGFSGEVSFVVNLTGGNYSWNCGVTDINGNESFYFEDYDLGATGVVVEDDDSDDVVVDSGGSSKKSSGSGSSGGHIKSVVNDKVVLGLGEEDDGEDVGISLQSVQRVEDDEVGFVFVGILAFGLMLVFWLVWFLFL
ncbi:MAG: CARDB domain-containing protein [archaeon]